MSNNNPISVRTLVNELIQESKEFANEIKDDKLVLFLQANGKYPEFFFKINRHEFSNLDNEIMYSIEFSPQTINNENPLKYYQNDIGVKKCLTLWLSIIYQYPNINKAKNTKKSVQESDILKELNIIKDVKPTPRQKAFNWSMIPEWAKILGGLGAIASLVKVIIELNK